MELEKHLNTKNLTTFEEKLRDLAPDSSPDSPFGKKKPLSAASAITGDSSDIAVSNEYHPCFVKTKRGALSTRLVKIKGQIFSLEQKKNNKLAVKIA